MAHVYPSSTETEHRLLDRAFCLALQCLDDALELYSYANGWPDEKRDRELWHLAKDSARSFARLNPDEFAPPDELDEAEPFLNAAAANQPDLARLGTAVGSNHHQLARRFYVSLLEAAWFAVYGPDFDFRQFDPAAGAIRFVQSWPAVRAAILAVPGCEPFLELWDETRAWIGREYTLATRACIGTSGDDRNPEAQQPTLFAEPPEPVTADNAGSTAPAGKESELSELERTTPPLDKAPGKWVSNKKAAQIEGLDVSTLRAYRSDGIKKADGSLGRDAFGRVWRRVGTPRSHPRYLRSSLSPSDEHARKP